MMREICKREGCPYWKQQSYSLRLLNVILKRVLIKKPPKLLALVGQRDDVR
jgi:hypothetical protein